VGGGPREGASMTDALYGTNNALQSIRILRGSARPADRKLVQSAAGWSLVAPPNTSLSAGILPSEF